jgi:hypothetical protein
MLEHVTKLWDESEQTYKVKDTNSPELFYFFSISVVCVFKVFTFSWKLEHIRIKESAK